jgi:regulator of PEP synthase PpsR (kinase-PPPase family)
VEEIVAEAAAVGGVIFYTLVSPETRRAIDRASRERFVPIVDVLGPVLSALDDVFQSTHTATPGLLYASRRATIDRGKAIRYTLEHDDGQRPHELSEADVVLVGVSRSSKTATCYYLAFAGVRAANVPLVPGIKPPRQLLEIPPEKVVGLRVNTMRLRNVRLARFEGLKQDDIEHYVEKRAIANEVIGAMRQMKEHGWRSIDVSYRAVEEIASRVMEMCDLKRRRQ